MAKKIIYKECENCGAKCPVHLHNCGHCGYCFLDSNVYAHKDSAFHPSYVDSLEEGISMLQRIHNEEKTNKTDFGQGYRFGLRIGMNTMINLLKKQMYGEKKEP